MAPRYNLQHATKHYPFMTCLVKVNTQCSWQKTVARVLNKCHGVYTFRMGDEGLVEISGTADPKLLLNVLGKAGRKAELRWFQFGECSSNLFMQTTSQDGRYLHSSNLARPQQPYGHKHHYQIDYGHNHDYGVASDYRSAYDYQHSCDYGGDYRHSCDYKHGYRHSTDMGCCIIM